MDFRGFNVRSHQFKETPGNSTQRLKHSLSSSSDIIEELWNHSLHCHVLGRILREMQSVLETVILSNRTTFFVHFTGLIFISAYSLEDLP